MKGRICVHPWEHLVREEETSLEASITGGFNRGFAGGERRQSGSCDEQSGNTPLPGGLWNVDLWST